MSKRQVKAPKVYLADSGILHGLLNQKSLMDLEGHPKLGASWEGFVLDQLVRHLGIRWDGCYFWATYAGAELDLLIIRGRQRFGFEIKRAAAPQLTPFMRIAMDDLGLKCLYVIHAGEHSYPLAKRVRAVALSDMQKKIESVCL